jgi:transcriptional regulator with XRE-family HTH domain
MLEVLNSKTIGINVRKIRKTQGLTSEKLAKKVGVVGSFIRELEINRKNFTLPMINRIASVLNVDISQLLTDVDKPKDPLVRLTDMLNIPVYATVPSGGVKTLDDKVVEYMPIPREMVQGVRNPEHNVFWIVAQGESM